MASATVTSITSQAAAIRDDAIRYATPVVMQWTGREIRALRLALRMTNEEFAAHLGVGARTVAKWNTHPYHVTVPELQRALDTALDQAPGPARERFALALTAGEPA